MKAVIIDSICVGIMAANGLLAAAGAGVSSHHICGQASADSLGAGAKAAIHGQPVIDGAGTGAATPGDLPDAKFWSCQIDAAANDASVLCSTASVKLRQNRI
jgi:hypothetical protein